jgi:hypothetical protein
MNKRKYKDVREDGWMFLSYTKRILSDGSEKLYEHWLSPEAMQKRTMNHAKRVSFNRRKNKEKYNKTAMEYREKNRERNLCLRREWYQKNITRLRAEKRVRSNNRRKTDNLYKLTENCRNLIRKAIIRMGYSKKSKTTDLLGCDFKQLKSHLESKFTNGINWDNYGKWHIDHIVPIASAQTEDEIVALNHYTNLQPLWAEENIRKGANQNFHFPLTQSCQSTN